MLKDYKTLKTSGKAQEKFKNSLFVAHAGHVANETEAKAFLKEIKGLHKDADHNVSAYIVKTEDFLIFKYDDDGEPAGSSGKPIFKLLESKELIMQP
jgi:putative IMPACT (imprinted ancient) family translation regulator